jgi:hypothetical protein
VRRSLRLFILSAALLPTMNAQIFGIGNATEWTQLLNHVQLVMQYAKQAETALRTVQMAQIAVQEGKELVEHPSTNIFQDIMMFQNVLALQARG